MVESGLNNYPVTMEEGERVYECEKLSCLKLKSCTVVEQRVTCRIAEVQEGIESLEMESMWVAVKSELGEANNDK